MKKRRRIEITAFRRTVTMHGGPGMEPPPQSPGSGPCSADDSATHLNQGELVEALLSRIDDEGSPQLEHLIEALIASNDENAGADEQAVLEPNRIQSVLRSLGVPVIRLRELLDHLRSRGSLKPAKKTRRD